MFVRNCCELQEVSLIFFNEFSSFTFLAYIGNLFGQLFVSCWFSFGGCVCSLVVDSGYTLPSHPFFFGPDLLYSQWGSLSFSFLLLACYFFLVFFPFFTFLFCRLSQSQVEICLLGLIQIHAAVCEWFTNNCVLYFSSFPINSMKAL